MSSTESATKTIQIDLIEEAQKEVLEKLIKLLLKNKTKVNI